MNHKWLIIELFKRQAVYVYGIPIFCSTLSFCCENAILKWLFNWITVQWLIEVNAYLLQITEKQ